MELLGLAGVVANDTAVRDSISRVLIAAFPPLQDLIDSALDAITKGAAAASILGVIGLAWTVSNLYGALDVAFARIYTGIPERDMVRRTARGFLVVGLLAIAIIALVLIAGLAAALDSTALGRRGWAFRSIGNHGGTGGRALPACLVLLLRFC